jgi:hypothetical protein
METFEPGDSSSMMAFRAIYGITGVLASAGLVALSRKPANMNSQRPKT